MLDLNDLRVFERIAALGGFTAAARSLGMPKASVSRSIARLEADLGICLLNRTTRRLALTPAGKTLHERCGSLLADLQATLDGIIDTSGSPKGTLRISSGIGFGIKALSQLLPAFLARYPDVRVSLDLTSKLKSQVGDEPDVAIRLGPLPDSSAKCVSLGSMKRYLCASPAYLERRGTPQAIEEIAVHDTIEMPRGDGRPRVWEFEKDGKTESVELTPIVSVNEALTIASLVQNGVGLGVISSYLCQAQIQRGDLIRLFPDWTLPPIEVNLVFASKRELSTLARAFVDFMREATTPGDFWLKDLE